MHLTSMSLIVILSAVKNPAGLTHPGKRRANPNGFFAELRVTGVFRRLPNKMEPVLIFPEFLGRVL